MKSKTGIGNKIYGSALLRVISVRLVDVFGSDASATVELK